MQRRQLVHQVMTELDSATERVDYPDHPLLLRGPDVLALARGRLTAYFVYKAGGTRPTSTQERSRFLLTRLAFPPGTGIVLVTDTTATVDFGPNDILVDAIVTIREFAQFSRSSTRFESTDTADVIEDVRRFHSARFAEAWTRAFDVPEPTRARSERPGDPTSEIAARRDNLKRARWMQVDNGVLHARSPARTGSDLRRAVARTTVAATSLDYDLTLGLSGVAETSAKLRSGNGHLVMHYFHDEQAPRKPAFDAFKPQRAAAFAGVEAVRSGPE
ncbi:hypothetical protein HD557_004158 [Nocardioides luteus]|nr:hypothetical protein [Nocardioides luteus]